LTRISRLLLRSISLIVVLAVGCTPTPANQNLADTHWKLITLNGRAPFTGGDQITLNFDPSNQISGNTGCNSYGGNYILNGNALSFDKMFSTLRACADQSANDQEAAYNQTLSSIATFEVSNDQLSFKDASGTVVLVFSKA
jgi:heat shock protein HslJ